MTRKLLVLALGLVALVAVVAALYGPVGDYLTTPESILENTEWTWDEKEASTNWYVANYKGPFEVRHLEAVLKLAEGKGWRLQGEGAVEFAKGGEVVFSLPTVPFLDVGGDTIVYAKCVPISVGCEVVAFDLSTRKPVWETVLPGAGPVTPMF